MAGHIGSSSSVSWCTPKSLLDAVRATLGTIQLDPCSNSTSTVGADTSIAPPNNGLEADWTQYNTIYVNPPFGTSFRHIETGSIIMPKEWRSLPDEEKALYRRSTIANWIEKCAAAHTNNSKAQIIALVPAAVDTRHWQQTIFPTASAVCFLKGRVKFVIDGVTKGAAPMACALVYWGSTGKQKFIDSTRHLGTIHLNVKADSYE